MSQTIPATRAPARPPQALQSRPQRFTPLSLTPERIERMLACLNEHAQVSSTQLSGALGLTRAAAQPLINDLCSRGLARRGGTKRQYERAYTPVNRALVRDHLRPAIRACLSGRPALASGIARQLGEPGDIVAETCKVMHLEGELHGALVGAVFVYSLPSAVAQEASTPPPASSTAPVSASPRRKRVTEDVVRAVQAALPPDKRRAGGEVKQVAERFDLSPSQVYRALKQVLPPR
ncbi:MarR family winged helix-turn-helix transcriptional regulator [Deinococcus sp. DB0503]|uniref:MarR family winged helix-turn-helix transcriptional regulator n=1 Tax=Deinococcus sp. DB0503 TaxID=2479203 RepID=UPI0018DFBAB1|nr:MarR family winged helix-turn-helix transcriptional regulator [Deinococcus sp. DB0503]MBI0446880.1 MarR family transcriptional regulator [Deinococcus sp. DB0503]